MAKYTYKQILQKAKDCKNAVEKKYDLGISPLWSYFFAESILNPKKDIQRIDFNNVRVPESQYISRNIYKTKYIQIAKDFISFTKRNKRIPNYIVFENIRVGHWLYTYMLARIVVYYAEHGQLPAYVNVNSKVFTKPTESSNKVYDTFVKVFGKITCIDDALEKIAGRGYGHYNDDWQSNIQTINSIKSSSHSDDPNCTDACQMMKNVADGTKKYKKVDVVHVHCSGGDGHVFLKITQKDGGVFYRDPAAVLSSGDITKVWCSTGTVLGINPSWFMENLNR